MIKLAQDVNEAQHIAELREMKNALVEVHKKLRKLKAVPYRESPYFKAMREIKLGDTNLQQGIHWLNDALYELKNASEQPQQSEE